MLVQVLADLGGAADLGGVEQRLGLQVRVVSTGSRVGWTPPSQAGPGPRSRCPPDQGPGPRSRDPARSSLRATLRSCCARAAPRRGPRPQLPFSEPPYPPSLHTPSLRGPLSFARRCGSRQPGAAARTRRPSTESSALPQGHGKILSPVRRQAASQCAGPGPCPTGLVQVTCLA
jgi:hypothetical protein